MSDSITRIDNIVNPFVHSLTQYLRGREKKLVHLLYAKGLTQPEIAKQLGVTVKTISLYYPKSEFEKIQAEEGNK